MSKPLKIGLGIAGGLVVLLVAAAIALPLLFDPNHFRAQISSAVNERYHRSLELGDIKLSVFPWLKVKVSNVKFGNAEGFGPAPFAEVGELDVGVRLLPLLLDRKVEASTVTLTGLQLRLHKNAKGDNNWSDLAKPKDDKEQPKNDQGGAAVKGIAISGVEIHDAALDYVDDQSGKHYSVDKLNLKTGTLTPGKPFDLSLTVAVDSKAPAAHIDLSVDGTVLADTDAKTYSVDNLKLAAELSGDAVPSGKQRVELTGSALYDQAQGSAALNKAKLQVAGLTLETEISASDLNSDKPKLSGPLTLKPFKPRELMMRLGMKAPETADKSALNDAALIAQYNGDFNSAMLSNLNLKLDQTSFTGSVGVRDFASQALQFALAADQLDADRYLPPKAAGDKAAASDKPVDHDAKRAELNAIKLPLDALNALNVSGSLDLGTLKVNGLSLSNVHLKLAGAKNSPKQQELVANLYGGQIKATTRVNGRNLAVDTQLQSLNTGPFLKDLVGKDNVSGTGNLKLSLRGNGVTVGDLRRSLNGDVSFNLQNGAVKGFNLGQIIRRAQASIAGQTLAAKDTTVEQTDFASFSAAGKIANGILSSDSLDAKSPLFRLTGAGTIDLVNETLSYTAKPTIVETSQGQGGKELDALRGVTIPIVLSGSVYSPQYRVALGDVLKQQAGAQIQKQLDAHKGELQQKLNDKLGSELGGALGKLFGGGQQQPQQQPQPATDPATQQPATTK